MIHQNIHNIHLALSLFLSLYSLSLSLSLSLSRHSTVKILEYTFELSKTMRENGILRGETYIKLMYTEEKKNNYRNASLNF